MRALGRWAAGPLGRWAAGPLGRWAAGPLGRWAAGLLLIFGTSSVAKAVVNPDCANGHVLGSDRVITFVANIQSFLDYSASRSYGWTEEEVRREIIAVLDEWTHRGQANVTLRLADLPTDLVGFKSDGINVISICDPSRACTDPDYCCASPCARCGGGAVGACTGAPQNQKEEADIVLFNRTGSYWGSCAGNNANDPPSDQRCNWLLRKQTSGGQAPQFFRLLLHEIGHGLGLEHYPAGAFDAFSVMNSGAGAWQSLGGGAACDLNLLSVQRGDMTSLQEIYGVRTDTIRARLAVDNGDPVSWTSAQNAGGGAAISTLAGPAALKSRSANNILFARIGDGTETVDTSGPNGVSVYGYVSSVWALRNVLATAVAASAPALAYAASRYVLIWHNNINQVVRTRSAVGSVTSWATSTAGSSSTFAFTSQRPAIAYEPLAGRTYRLFINDTPGMFIQAGLVSGVGSTCAEVNNILYQASNNDGDSWTTRAAAMDFSTGAVLRSSSGLDFSCLDDPAETWPCSLTYVRWADSRVVWRRVRPNPADANLLQFGPESEVGDSSSYSTRAPTIEGGVRGAAAGGSVPDWLFLSVFVRNGDQPATTIRKFVINGLYPFGQWYGRFLGLGAPGTGFLAALTSSPAVGHSNLWSVVHMLFTEQN